MKRIMSFNFFGLILGFVFLVGLEVNVWNYLGD